jgi:ABC-type branched-subunit amino acid transport system substrate-binding protein
MSPKSRLGLLLGTVVALAAHGCERALPDKGQDTPPAKPDTIKIGLVTVLGAGFGDSPTNDSFAVDLAVTQINAAGGVLGKSVELVVGDFGGDESEIDGVVRDLVNNQGVVGLLASETTGETTAAAKVAAELKIPQISCCATASGLKGQDYGGFLFRTAPSDDLQARAVLKVAESASVTASNADGVKRGAVIYVDDDYGKPFRDNLQTGLPSTLRILDEVPLAESPTSSQISDIISGLQQKEAEGGNLDFIVLIAFEDSGGEVVNAWYRQGGHPVFWIPTDGVYSQVFIDTIKQGAPQAFAEMMGTSPAAIPDSSNFIFFRNTYLATYGREPLAFTAHQYDATVLLLLAMEAAGSTDGSKVRDALFTVSRDDSGGDDYLFRPNQISNALESAAHGKKINYDGASGDVDFDDQGNVVSGYALWQVVKMGDGYIYNTASYVDGRDLRQ